MTSHRERAEKLIAGIEHGDDEHRKWLRETFTPQIESAFREVEAQALEKAAEIVNSAPYGSMTIREGQVQFVYWERESLSLISKDIIALKEPV